MEIKIEGDPGTGNNYTEINVRQVVNKPHIEKQIIVNCNPHGGKNKVSGHQPASSDDKEVLRQEILTYVGKTLPFVLYQWKDKYKELWTDILALPEVDAVIYEKGRQERTAFNRKEVCHIICYIGKHAVDGMGIFEKYNASHIALCFNDDAEKSTRPELGYKPSLAIRNAIDDLFKAKKYL